VPLAEGEAYRPQRPADAPTTPLLEPDDEDDTSPDDDNEDDEAPARAKKRTKSKPGAPADAKTAIQWIESIPAGRFYLRVGLGRKASGSYYTPHAFVRFLVESTLGPQIRARSPATDPHPAEILRLRVLDPAMGSGHFLVEACRHLGFALYEACRLCDDLAAEADAAADAAKDPADKARHQARALELRRRLDTLPDQAGELVAFLPSRAPEGTSTGLSQRRAEAICRRLIAVHCLYGVDKNPLAVGLARVVVWLEAHAEGLPLTFLDHRLIHGDSIAGPFTEHLLTWPQRGEPIDSDLFGQTIPARLEAALAPALAHVRDLESTIGKDLADNCHKELAKERLDRALAPFRTLAAAWSGALRLGPLASADADDAYARLASAVAAGRDLKALIADDPVLKDIIDAGREGVAYDLAFPEVFHADRHLTRTGGFDVVLGNPPWDAVQPLAKEFFAALDLRILSAATRREREPLEAALLLDPSVRADYDAYTAEFEATKRSLGRFTPHAGKEADGRPSGAVMDVWHGFAERGPQLLRTGGRVGWVLPSAFHANQSATGLREFYLNELALRCCYSFENRNKLFEIHRSFKFATVVAERDPAGTRDFDCAFYLHDLGWLKAPQPLRYTREFVRKTSPDYWSLLELRTEADANVATTMFETENSIKKTLATAKIRCSVEIDMSKGAWRFTSTADITPADPRDPEVAAELRDRGYLPLHEGKTFHHFDDHWAARPRYLVALDKLTDKPTWLDAACHYRLAFRDIARSTDERTGIFCLLPPGVVCGNKAPCEREPRGRPLATSLVLLAVTNSFTFDFALRTKVQATVNLFILNACPYPNLDPATERFLAHAALRLTCNHAGYAPLWHDQLGTDWREPAPHPTTTWPVLPDPDARWRLRAVVDAVVAHAYGLTRSQYAHLLGTFSHTSYPAAPDRCLTAFDDLQAHGLPAFLRLHDPYFDLPLPDHLPTPVLPIALTQAPSTPTPTASDTLTQRTIEHTGQAQLFTDHGPLFANLPPDTYLPHAADAPQRAPKRGGPLEAAPVAKAHAADAPQRANPTATVAPPRAPTPTAAPAPLSNTPHNPPPSQPPAPTSTPSAAYETILALLRARGAIASADAQAATGLTANEVRPHLQRLLAEGHAHTEGQKRGTKYILAPR
jgi:hypothetical protein